MAASFTIRRERPRGHRARRTGGLTRTRRAAVLRAETPDHPVATPLRTFQTSWPNQINQFRRGELNPKAANAVGYLATVLLRTLEQGPLDIQVTLRYTHLAPQHQFEAVQRLCNTGVARREPIDTKTSTESLAEAEPIVASPQ